MKRSRLILSLHCLLAIAAITSFYHLFSLKGLHLNWPIHLQLSQEMADVWFAINSGLFSGITIYFLTSVLPNFWGRGAIRNEMQKELCYFVSSSMELLNNSGIVFKDQSAMLTKKEFQKANKDLKYGDTPKNGHYSIAQRLRVIHRRQQRLTEKSIAYYNHLMFDRLSDQIRSVTRQKLFNANLNYHNIEIGELITRKVDLSVYLLDFYNSINSLQLELDCKCNRTN